MPSPDLRWTSRINRILAIIAVAVLMIALALLGWLRHKTLSQLNDDVLTLAASFQPEAILHGRGGNTLVHFERVESFTDKKKLGQYIHEVLVSRLWPDGREDFIFPYKFNIDYAKDLQQTLATYDQKRLLLDDKGRPFARLYLKFNLEIVHRLNWTIGAIAAAIILMLATLLARVWSQESSLTKTVIELRERRRELIRLERLALAGQVSAGLLHDLRKPVLNIRHSVEEMKEALGDFAPAAPALQDLQRNTQLFFEILGESQIERFVRSDHAGEEFVDLDPILDFSFNLVRFERRGVEVERAEIDNLPPVYAHPFRLIQLFSNLILNVYQALNGNGKLRVEAIASNGGVLARLTDNGPGIPPEIQERIFDPFFTTKPEGEGTGLGLSICRLIVEELGGTIRVESQVGGPTSFIVWLPGERSPFKEQH